jgi:hypothetical protein
MLRRGTGGYWQQKALQDLLTLHLAVVLNTGTTVAAVAIAVIVVRFPRYAPPRLFFLDVNQSAHCSLVFCRAWVYWAKQGWQGRGLWWRVLLVGGARAIQGLLW